KRFSRIYHLMPFYFPDKSVDAELAKRIIPVFDNSIYFQGFMAAGYNTYRHEDASHYIFVADDLMLNPDINEDNYANFFELDAKDSFVQSVYDIPQPFDKSDWGRIAQFSFVFDHYTPGLDETHKLPSVEDAIDKFKSLGYATQPVRTGNKSQAGRILLKALSAMHVNFPLFCRIPRSHHRPIIRSVSITHNFLAWFNKIFKFKLSYPLVRGFSDLTIVPHNKMEKFCHYCGVFAGLNLFVEIAIPTTLVLLQEEDSKLMTDKDSRFQTFHGHPHHLHPLNLHYQNLPADTKINTLDDMLAAFPREYLYIHSIKLSRLSQD
ncbi:MAG: hypothetical protein K0U41_05380, partial [Gammaproteobacteria bacterium]|nr:hypothetical protein [Gammaproteobacteria bacterium]